MKENRWDIYLDETLSHVKFKFDHKVIRKELLEHLEDLSEDLQAEGMDANLAESLAVDCMGDAAEVGQALNKEHGVISGWIWMTARVFFIVILLVCVPALSSALTFVSSTVGIHFRGYDIPYESRNVTVMKTIDVDESLWIGDMKFTIDEIRYLDDGNIDICYKTFYKKNTHLRVWENGNYGAWEITDDEGNIGKWEWIGSGGTRIYRKHVARCTGIPQTAESLHITLSQEWDNQRIDVPLT